jgi:hypothetical protein
VLVFGIRNATERGPEADADTRLRLFARPRQVCVFERELSRGDSELGVTVEALEPFWRENFFRRPIRNFTGAMRIEWRCIETGDARNAAAFGADAVPELLSTNADAGDRSEASDNGATLHCCSSTYAFMQRNVLFATG